MPDNTVLTPSRERKVAALTDDELLAAFLAAEAEIEALPRDPWPFAPAARFRTLQDELTRRRDKGG